MPDILILMTSKNNFDYSLDTCKVYLNVSKLSFSPILENNALISVCDMIVLIKEAEVKYSNKNKHY